MDVLKNPVVDAAGQVLQEAISLIHDRFPEDLPNQIDAGAKEVFAALNLGGGIITVEAILAHYQQQRGTHRR